MVIPELRQGLQAEDDNRDEDDQDGDDGDASGRPGALRVLKEQPDLALELLLGERPLLLPNETLVLPELLHGLLPQLVETNLLGEDINGDVDGSSDAPARLVVIEDGVEAGPVPVEEILVAQGVEVTHPFTGVPQQRLGELRQRFQLSLEAQPRDVDHHPLAALVLSADLRGMPCGAGGGRRGVFVAFPSQQRVRMLRFLRQRVPGAPHHRHAAFLRLLALFFLVAGGRLRGAGGRLFGVAQVVVAAVGGPAGGGGGRRVQQAPALVHKGVGRKGERARGTARRRSEPLLPLLPPPRGGEGEAAAPLSAAAALSGAGLRSKSPPPALAPPRPAAPRTPPAPPGSGTPGAPRSGSHRARGAVGLRRGTAGGFGGWEQRGES